MVLPGKVSYFTPRNSEFKFSTYESRTIKYVRCFILNAPSMNLFRSKEVHTYSSGMKQFR